MTAKSRVEPGRLSLLRGYLLPKLLSGAVRVREAGQAAVRAIP